ncbi:hypothetical protein PFICI_03569 [Pestalotiopsis fici W106-1]|uniref:Ketoreductase domain-containing protein n=1 Tax=Pestalotiopsis fici (strain W106-1 / CGMCC3.15140) TaxID=1229662 RepID=W3XHR5_PESFW|nr:uncharacterized protein PFICI_03569 [Pestalotiopsis fici W106-1]ETS85544.1 hypothetical protein PFICI_03569 [Pestalotiopsis fici W106-1]
MAITFPSPTKTFHSDVYSTIHPTRPELSAKGKNVLITGGGTGIGAETARSFAQAGAARIALVGRREQPLLDTKASILEKHPDIEVITAPTDVTKQSEVDAAFAKFLGEDGKLDILVSNAAVSGPRENVSEADPNYFLEGIQQNLGGALWVSRAFTRYASPNATVVNVSSSAAHMNFGGLFASYSVAKWSVYRLWDLVGHQSPNLRVFHIQPGIVDTAMNREAGGIAASGHEDKASLPAGFMVWLASPEAEFLKGKFLWTNWDVDELKAKAEEIQNGSFLNLDLVGWPFNDTGSKYVGEDWKW